jgi:hypothetical protein
MPDPRLLKILKARGWKNASTSAGCGFLLLIVMGSFASSAPPQIQNKTVTASWSVDYTFIAPSGRIFAQTVSSQRVVYVSSAGRIFVRQSYNTPRGSESAETGPGEKTPDGGARDVRFEGGKIVAMAAIPGGMAGRMVISFNQSYSTCTVDVTIGRSGRGPPVMRRGGVLLEVKSRSISGQNCSVREGNAFANQ